MKKVPTEITDLKTYLESVVDNQSLLDLKIFDEKFERFLSYIENLYKDWFPKAKSYTDEHIAEKLFIKEVQLKDIKHHIKYQLITLKNSCERINSSIDAYKQDTKYQLQLFDELRLIKEICFETLVFLNWSHYYIAGEQAQYGYFKRNVLYSAEIFSASQMILRNRLYEKSLGGFVIPPTSVFLIRQTIEIRIKNAYGIEGIYYLDGKPYKKRIGEVLFGLIRDSEGSIEFPIKISILQKMYKWTNYYIHDGLIPNIWEIEFAQYLLKPLFTPGIYKNVRSIYGSIKIKKVYYDKVQTIVKRIIGNEDIVVQRLKNPEALIID